MTKTTSIISALLAALIPLANASFGWNLQTSVILSIVLGCLGLALVLLGHDHVGAKGKQSIVLTDLENVLHNVATALGELHKSATVIKATDTTVPKG